GALLAEWTAYDPAFRGGAYVAVADLDGDGKAEVVTGAGEGGGPHVRAFKVTGSTATEVLSVMAYDPAFRGGVRVAAGDTDGDGRAEVVTVPASESAAFVRAVDATKKLTLEAFAAFDPAFTGGASAG